MRVCLALVTGSVVYISGCVDLGVPQWSPDGRRIAFVHLDSRERPEVWFVDLDKTPVPKKLAGEAFRPQWSADGERIFFLAIGGAGGPLERVVLRSCRPDGSDIREHAPGPEGSLKWYALGSSGRSAYYLRGDTHELFELDLPTGRAARVLAEGSTCRAAAFEPASGLLAVALEPEGELGKALQVRVIELPRREGLAEQGRAGTPAGSDLQAKDRTEGQTRARSGPSDLAAAPRSVGTLPSSFVSDDETKVLWLLFRPGGKELLAFLDPAEEIHVLPLGRGRTRKLRAAAGGGTVCAAFSTDARFLYLTTATSVSPVRFALQRLELDSGKAEVLLEGASVPVSGPGWARDGDSAAELTPMGLRVWAADGRWERLYPVSPDEYALAAESRLNAGEPAEALAYVRRALEEPGRGGDIQRLGLLESDAHAALGEPAEAARALLRAWLLWPVSEVEPAEVERRMKALRGEDRLVAALYSALRSKGAARAKALAECMPLAGEARLLAGLSFRIAEAELLAGGSPAEASKRFRHASETPEFPAADYAAGLAALAQFVWGRNDRYAEELMLKAIDSFPGSVLQDDFRAALALMRKEAGAMLRRTSEDGAATGAAAWITVRSVRSVEWSLDPTLVDSADVRRRLVLRVEARSSLHVARPGERSREILSGVAAGIGELAFSPDGMLLAFLAKGRATGYDEPVWAAAFVVDLDGGFLAGDREALLSNAVAGEGSIEDASWDEAGKALLLRVRPAGLAPLEKIIKIR